MARKRTLDRRALRDQSEAAEAREKDDEEVEEGEEEEEEAEEAEGGDEEGDEEAKPKPKKKAAAKKPAAKKPATKRTRVKEAPRMRAVWVVFDNGSKRIDTFPYPQKAEAEALLARKIEEKKGTFYLQLVKEPLTEG